MFKYSEENCAKLKAMGDDIDKFMCKLSEEDQAEAIMDAMISENHGHYSPYPLSPTLRLLENHKFCHLPKFLDFINLYENRKLHVECNLESVRQNFTKLQIPAPFNLVSRFPDNFYVHMDSKTIKTATEQFMDDLDLIDQLKEIQMNNIIIPSNNNLLNMNSILALCNRTQSYKKPLRTLGTICKSTDIEYLKKNGVYSRETFEEEYNLIWVYTPRY